MYENVEGNALSSLSISVCCAFTGREETERERKIKHRARFY